MSEYADYQVGVVKKYYPNPGALLSKKISTITTTVTAGSFSHNSQTDATGIKSLVLTPVSFPVLLCVNAPDDATAKLWLDDATENGYGLQVIYVPVGNMIALPFSTLVTRWDMKAIGTATAAYQRIAR